MLHLRGLLLLALVLEGLAAVTIPATPPLGFEENRGQYSSAILYGYRPGAYLTASSLVLAPSQVSIQFAGANPNARMTPGDTLPGHVNTFSGADQQRWLTNLNQYASVLLPAIYPGIDASFLIVTGNPLPAPSFTYRLSLAPGADPGAVRIAVTGAQGLTVLNDRYFGGSLQISLSPGASLLQSAPVAHQGQASIAAHYSVLDSSHFTVVLDPYDKTQPVTIDMSFPGTPQYGFGTQLTAAPSGAFYQIGNLQEVATQQTAPVGGTCRVANGYAIPCNDVAVAKYSPAGQLIYISYLRGSGDQNAKRVAVQEQFGSIFQAPAENVYLTGETSSPDFPVTPTAFQKTYAGAPAPDPENYVVSGDIFVAKLDGNTGALLYSTYLGGPAADFAWDLHAVPGADFYVVGSASSGLPVTNRTSPPAACPHYGCEAGFAARFDRNSGALRYLTYLPYNSVKTDVDSAGNLYFTGASDASTAFAAKLDGAGMAVLYTTYFRGATSLQGYEIAVDSQSSAWVSGIGGTGVQGTVGATYFLAKLDAAGKQVYHSPFIEAQISVDPSDNLVLVDVDAGSDSTTVKTPGGYLTTGCGPGYLAKIDPGGMVVLARVMDSNGSPIGFDNQGRLVVSTYQGIASIDLTSGPRAWTTCVYDSASMSGRAMVAPGEIVTVIGAGLGPASGVSSQVDAEGRAPTSLAGTRVLFNGVPGPVLYAQDGQVNAIVPFGAAPGTAMNVQVEYQGSPLPPLSAGVTATDPYIFTSDGSGTGQALAFNQDGTLNNPANPALLGSLMTIFVDGLGATSPASVEGAVSVSTDARPVANVAVWLAGPSPATVLYAGPSPGSLSSVTQINLRLPTALTGYASSWPLSGMPILIVVDGVYLPRGVTIAVALPQ